MKRILTSRVGAVVLFLLLAVCIEVLGFNYRALESRGLQEIPDTDYDIVLDQTDEDGNLYFELLNINQELKTIYLDLNVTKNDKKVDNYAIRLEAIDEGNAVYLGLPKTWLKDTKESSKYLKLNLSGKVSSIKVNLAEVKETEEDDVLGFSPVKVSLNAERPFHFSAYRFIFIAGFLFVLYFLRPGSAIFTTEYNIKDIRQALVFLGIFLVLMLGIIFVGLRDPKAGNPTRIQNFQYEKLAVALTKGQFYLDDEPSEELINLSNPYDRNLRTQEEVPLQWDHAYFEGKYYVYFGITPVLLFYLPYYLVTGSGFPTFVAMVISEMILILAVFLLLHYLVRKYYPKLSFGHFMILNLFTLVGSGLPYIIRYQTFYALPIVCGLFFTIFSIYFWLSAVRDEGLSWIRVFWGCVCMALVAGCRPQMLLGSFLALPILIPALLKEWKAKKGKALISLVVVLMPYIVFGLFLMYYNYARFGSVFDFGANYNITTNDMTQRGFRLDRIPLGIYTFLFQPPSFGTQFPFFQKAPFSTAYQGITIHEGTFGGIFMICPFLWMGLYGLKSKKWFSDKRFFSLTIICLLSALIISVADANMAGILPRYTCDFGIFLCIPAVLVALELFKRIQHSVVKNIYHYTLWGLAAFTGALGGLLCFL